MPPRYHLAQINIAQPLAPLDSEIMADFVAQLASINALAEASPGFVSRFDIPAGDPPMLVNLSVWESVEALRNFTYKTAHAESLRDRSKWFARPTQAHFALWWIPAGHTPTIEEARERLELRRRDGDTPDAFSFAKSYAPPEAIEEAA